MSWLHIHIQLHYRNSTSTRNIQSTDYSYRDFFKSAVGSAYGEFRVNRDMSVHQRIATSFNNTKSKFFISSFFTFLRCTHFLMFLDYKFRYPNIYLYINCFTWNQCQITSLKFPPFVNKSWSAIVRKMSNYSTFSLKLVWWMITIV
jgi:hypothetical protein